MVPEYDDKLGKWAAPFIMATINTKNVHRTNFLNGHPYGENFKYDEMMLTDPGEAGKSCSTRSDGNAKELRAKPPNLVKVRPSKNAKRDFMTFFLVAEMEEEKLLHYGVKGKYDPGYGSTSRMLAETGIALLSCDKSGGVGTRDTF